VPSTTAALAVISAPFGVSRRIARPVCDLPEPDSPTMPTFSRPIVNEMPLTARVTPRPPRNETLRSSTWSSGSAMTRIQHVAQPVAEQIEGEADHQDRRAGNGGDGAGGKHEFARRRENRAPFRARRLPSAAEEAEPRRGRGD